MNETEVRLSSEKLVNLCFLKIEYKKTLAPGQTEDAVVYLSLANEDIKKAFTDLTGIEWNDETCKVDGKKLYNADGAEITAEDLKMYADIGSFVQMAPDIKELLPTVKRITLAEDGVHKTFLRQFPVITNVGQAAIAPGAPCPCGSNKKYKKCCQFK